MKYNYKSAKTKLISHIQEPLPNEYWVFDKYLTKQNK